MARSIMPSLFHRIEAYVLGGLRNDEADTPMQQTQRDCRRGERLHDSAEAAQLSGIDADSIFFS